MAQVKSGGMTQRNARRSLGSIQVLLVEDNPGDARLTKELLSEATQERISLVCADRLSTALRTLESETVDAVLLDLSLPDVEGHEGLAQLHALHPALPIVVLSGTQDESLVCTLLERGAQGLFQKGQQNGDDLVRAIRSAIESRTP